MNAFGEVLQALSSLFRWWVCVAPWQRGLRVRAGRRVKLLTPGIWLTIPYLDRAYVQTIRPRFEVMNTQTVMTKDRKPLTVGATLGYAIDDIKKTFDAVDHMSETVGNIAAQALAEEAATLNLEAITPTSLSEGATRRVCEEFVAYGLGQTRIVVTDLVSVRTIRLIQDQRYSRQGSIDLNQAVGDPQPK